MHDESEYDIEKAEAYIEQYITGVDVTGVRIAPGPNNSPLFISLNTNSVSMETVKDIARMGLSGFENFVDGLDVEQSLRESNLRVKTVRM